MSQGLSTVPAAGELAERAGMPATTFGVIDVPDVTMAELIRAVIDDDSSAIKWPTDNESAERAILERLAGAQSVDALFGEQEGTGWVELLDVPVEVHGFRVLPSTVEGGNLFLVVDVYRLDEGERAVVTTSSKGVLVQLLQGVLLNAVPGVFKLIEVGAETKGRNRPQRLIRLGDLSGNPLDEPAA